MKRKVKSTNGPISIKRKIKSKKRGNAKRDINAELDYESLLFQEDSLPGPIEEPEIGRDEPQRPTQGISQGDRFFRWRKDGDEEDRPDRVNNWHGGDWSVFDFDLPQAYQGRLRFRDIDDDKGRDRQMERRFELISDEIPFLKPFREDKTKKNPKGKQSGGKSTGEENERSI